MLASDDVQGSQDGEARIGRSYRRYAVLVVAALLVVTIMAALGAVPGVLSPDEAFMLLGGATVVLVVATVGVLFALSETFDLLREHSDVIDAYQDRLSETRHEEQTARDEAQDQRFEGRVAELEERIEEVASGQAQATSEAQAARDEVQDQRFEGRIAELEEQIDELAAALDEATDAPAATPFGDIHEVEDVEGIGETYGDELRRMGIVDTEQLWQAKIQPVAEELDASPRTVRLWQEQAELMALKDVGPQYAELLARSGVGSIDELAGWEPGNLLERIEDKQETLDVNIQGANVNENRVNGWVKRARDHDPEAYRVRRSGPAGD